MGSPAYVFCMGWKGRKSWPLGASLFPAPALAPEWRSPGHTRERTSARGAPRARACGRPCARADAECMRGVRPRTAAESGRRPDGGSATQRGWGGDSTQDGGVRDREWRKATQDTGEARVVGSPARNGGNAIQMRPRMYRSLSSPQILTRVHGVGGRQRPRAWTRVSTCGTAGRTCAPARARAAQKWPHVWNGGPPCGRPLARDPLHVGAPARVPAHPSLHPGCAGRACGAPLECAPPVRH